ncbi:hypothetical protein GXN76_02215 [Kroppenstedtia pulmonis]|uniref:Uncharacterized protein n=1 Tax=Kroppenstedtia pulmonis TaxID=1380685 RepID=A0A7D3XPF7_9BACL|nr:hypothetical protein [Kroppenstedtia pulmonis]QKG83402.1 hypothetical protein GXN76_02215 [Kroppenstedtia pulmonis]
MKTIQHPKGPELAYGKKAKQTLGQSIAAEAVYLSVCSQLSAIFYNDLTGFDNLQRENTQAAHCRLTAYGDMERLFQQDWHHTVLSSVIHSMYQARHCDRLKKGFLLEMKRDARSSLFPATENLLNWLDFSQKALQDAMIYTREWIGPQNWDTFRSLHKESTDNHSSPTYAPS